MRRWLLLSLLFLAVPASARVTDGVAAVVDGYVITRSEVSELVALKRRMGAPSGDEEIAKALDALIENALVKREADRLGISVTDEDVEKAVADIRSRNGLTPEAFQAALAAQGMNYTAYLERVRNEIRRVKLAQQVLRARMKVGDEALREYYLKNVAKYREPDAVRLCHIQLPAPQGRELAERLRRRALAGEDVTELAREVSQGRSGDIGFMSVQNLSEDVRKAIASVDEGEVSDVVEMDGTCHIFAVLERRDGRVSAFEEVRDEIRDFYFREKEEELYRTWLDTLKAKVRIERKM
jgi:peptidyl-prolyl cis-trans isomerase SurA